jgi:hypothetical protein
MVAQLHRRDVFVALCLAAVAVLSWLPRLGGPIDLRWDGGAYYVLGTSLAQGSGYRLLNEPGEISSTLHPPVVPLIVAAHQLVLGTSDFATVGPWLRRTWLALFVAYAVAVYVMLRRLLPLAYAVPAALVCLFQLHTVFMSDLAFPEIPFGLTTVLFVLCHRREGVPTRSVLAAVLVATAFGLRTVGAALAAAWVLEGLCRRQYRQTGMRLLLAATLVLCWSGYIAYVESGDEYRTTAYEYQRVGYNYINVSYARNIQYIDPFSPELGYSFLSTRVEEFVRNIARMPVNLGEAVSAKAAVIASFWTEAGRRLGFAAPLPMLVANAALTVLAAFMVVGVMVQLRARQFLIPLYILFFVAMVCATPWPGQFNRYLAPLAPFLSISLFSGLKAAANRVSPWLPVRGNAIGAWLAAPVVFAILGCQALLLFVTYTQSHPRVTIAVGRDAPITYRLFFYRGLDRATDMGLDWLKMNGRGGVVVATDPQWAYLRTGMKAVLPPFEIDPQEAQRLLDTARARYLIVDDSLYKKYTAGIIANHPALWRQVFSTRQYDNERDGSTVSIYERAPEP